MSRWLLLWVAAAAVAWWYAWWPHAKGVALAGALAIACGHAWVLAIEFVVLHVLRGSDASPPPTPRQMLRAWWTETLAGFTVFAWRQPWRWRAVPDHVPHPPQAGLRGIVFIHGLACNRGFWTPWLREAQARGHAFAAVNLEPVVAEIDDYIPIVDEAVARMRQATGLAPVLICHSMGGVLARAWLRSRADAGTGADAVAHVVTIGSPHAGTWLAHMSRSPNVRQMRRDSPWLKNLHDAWTPALAQRFTCWYANCDNVVIPPSTATLPGADNRLVCGAAHMDMALRPEVMHETLDLVGRLDVMARRG